MVRRIPFIAFLALVIGLGAAFAQNKTLIIAVPSDIQNLDPTLSSGDILTQEVLTNLYSTLVGFKVEKNANGDLVGNPNQFQGELAKSFEVSNGGHTVTFHLRPGLKFANGDPIDAKAVKFTYDRIFGQNGVTAFLTKMASVDSADAVKVAGPLTVTFHVTTPNTLLFGNMAQFGHSILDPAVVKPHMTKNDPWAHDWLKNHAQGTESGPYILKSWDPGNQIVLERNPNYYGKVANDRIILKIIPDATNRLAQLEAGAVDIAYGIPTKDLGLLKEDPNVKLAIHTTRAVAYIGMNNTVKPFDNVTVRQAISYAVPYKTIIDNVINGYGIQLTSPIPNGTPYHTDKYFHYKQDFPKAKQLLAEAGYPHGFNATFQIPNDSAEAKQTAVWIQSALKNIGINVQIDEMPGAAFTAKMQKRQLTFFYANQWISINNDPFYHVFWLLKSSCCDYARYKNQQVWSLIDKYTLSTDKQAREQAALDIQKIVVDQAPWVFLFQPDNVIAMRKDITGYVWFSADRYMRYQYLRKTSW